MRIQPRRYVGYLTFHDCYAEGAAATAHVTAHQRSARLTKRTNTTKSPFSRRAAIAGAVAMTMSVAEAGAPDPIFPVLEKFRLAHQALSKR